MTATAYELAASAAQYLKKQTGIDQIDLALVLGSGWSAATDRLGEQLAELPLGEIPGFQPPAVAGHGGSLLIIKTPTGRLAAVLTGRTHYYEGKGADAVVHGVRSMAAWGARQLVLTNGCGGLNPEWIPGTVVLLRDHINLTGATPLVGPKFIDLSEAYSLRLRKAAQQIAPSYRKGSTCSSQDPRTRRQPRFGWPASWVETWLACRPR